MNKAEILRYMRTNSKTTDENILSLVDRAMTVTEENSAPKTLYRILIAMLQRIVLLSATMFSAANALQLTLRVARE